MLFYSFDVFDTCLTRMVANPADVFFLLAEKMLDVTERPKTYKSITAVANVRLRAEQLARRQMNGEDLVLDAIYQALPEVDPFGFDPSYMMYREMELEKNLLYPVPEIRARIAELRSQSHPILFISDMYLPQVFVREILIQSGLALPDDPVYVSGSAGVTKYTGTLFHHVMNDIGVLPDQIIHCGDNQQTDIMMPRSLGVNVQPFSLAGLTSREMRLRTMRDEFIEELSVLAGVSRKCRLDISESYDPSGVIPLVADVVAPILTSFVKWLLGKAKSSGWKRLYFISRDGQILQRIAQRIQPDQRGEVELRYLHGSRQSWFLSSLNEFDLERERSWLFVPGHSTAPLDILKKLNISPEDLHHFNLPAPDSTFWTLQLLPHNSSRFEQVLHSEAFAQIVMQRARKAREQALSYFVQEGLLDGETVVLVDIGWTLKAQQALRKSLELSGSTVDIHGVYFGVQMGQVPRSELNSFDAYVIEQPAHFDKEQPYNCIFRNANCIEQVFTAGDHGQVIGYRKNGRSIEPVLARRPSPERLIKINLIQNVICHYAELLSAQKVQTWRHELVRSCCIQQLKEFLEFPDRAEVTAIKEMTVFDDQNESRSRPLAKELGLREIADSFFFPVISAKDRYSGSFDWIEGSITISPRFMQPLLRFSPVFEKLRKLRIST